MPRSLRAQLIVYLFVVFAIALGGEVFLAIQDREERVLIAKDDARDHLHVIVARQRHVTELARRALTAIANEPLIKDPYRCHGELASRVAEEPAFINFSIADPKGYIRCSSDVIPQPAPNISDRAHFSKALETGGFAIGEYLLGRVSGQYTLVFAKPILDEAGAPKAIATASLDLDRLRDELLDDAVPATALIAVIDAQGMIVYGLPAEPLRAGTAFPSKALLADWSRAKSEQVVEQPNDAGVDYLYAFARVSEPSAGELTFIVGLPKAIAIAEPDRRFLTLLVLQVLLSAFCFFALWWGSERNLLRPIRALQEAAAGIGHGNLSARTGIQHTAGEFGKLARVFDDMAAAVQAKDASLQESAERLERVNRALRVISTVNRALVRSGSEAELLERACLAIAKAGDYQGVWIGLVDEHGEGKRIQPVAWSVRGGDSLMRGAELTWEEDARGATPAGMALRAKAPVDVANVADARYYEPWRKEVLKAGCRSAFASPLTVGDTTFGVIELCARSIGFAAEEIAILTEAAEDVGFGIATQRLKKDHVRITFEHEHHAQLIRDSLIESVQAIAATIDARDPYTSGHQRRVAEIAVAIAREMGLTEDRLLGLHLAAVIHDVGKVNVPAEILAKPSRLTKAEFELLKQHTQAGYDILKEVHFPWPIAEVVLQHHERLDGSGYPKGLRRDDIVLEAQIVAVADVMEAMASHRPYRAALGVEVALEELNRGSGTIYNATAVAICTKLFREMRLAL